MAVLKFNNLAEINQYLTRQTEKALKESLDATIPKLRFFIDEDVYRAYHPTYYKRTRWLKRRSGVIESYISHLQGLTRGGIRIVDDIYDAVSDRELFQHGNPLEDLPVQSFLEILNAKDNIGWADTFGFPTLIRPRSFWEDFTKWMESDEGIANIFKKKCNKYKIDLNNLGSDEDYEPEPPKAKEPAPTPQETPTSVTGTQMDRSDQGWHSIGETKKGKGITLNFNFGIGSGSSSALNQHSNYMSNYYNSTERIDE